MRISIVIPLFNEQESLAELADEIASSVGAMTGEWEIIFIDDGSTDRSFETLGRIREKYGEKIRVYRFSRNYGKAAALSVGFARARGETIVTLDADLQDDPAAIPGILSTLDQGWDVVSGWKKKRRDPFLSKNLPSRLFNFVTSLVSGLRIHDFNCGFKAYRREAAASLEIYGERHRYLPALAHWNGFRVTEAVVPHRPRKYGRSKYGLSRFSNGLLDLLTLLFLQKYMRNPLHFFGILGLVLEIAGGAILAYFGIRWIVVREMHIRPLVLLSVGSLIMGIQFISIGFLGEMIAQASAKNTYVIRDSIE